MRTRRCSASNVAIVKNEDEALAIQEAFGLLNYLSYINNDDVIVITPNWVNKQAPNSGTVVGPESLRQIIRMVKSKNPKRVVVATGSADGETKDIMEQAGFSSVIAQEGVEFIDLNYGPYTEVALNHSFIKKTKLNLLLNEATIIISFTQLKHHEEATMSAAIKNIALGWPSAEEHGHPKKNLGIHTELHGFISAMAECVPIDISIVSASPTMIGTGPSKGVARHTGIVLAGTDPVATDTVAARLLGFKPQGVRYLFECSNKNIGQSDINRINILGIPLLDAENQFSKAAYGDSLAVDQKK